MLIYIGIPVQKSREQLPPEMHTSHVYLPSEIHTVLPNHEINVVPSKLVLSTVPLSEINAVPSETPAVLSEKHTEQGHIQYHHMNSQYT